MPVRFISKIMQKHRVRKVTLVVALGLAVLLCVIFVGRPETIRPWRAAGKAEPVVAGKALSGWIAQLDYQDERGERARTVVRQWALNSLPLLLDWLNLREPLSIQVFPEPQFAVKANELLSKFNVASFQLTVRWQPNKTRMAFALLHELGPAAKPAIPGLLALLDVNNEPFAVETRSVLKDMAPLSVPYLIQALSNRTERAQTSAGIALGELGVVGKVEPSVLRSMLLSDVLGVRFAGARALHELGEEPSKIIPILVEGIQHGDHDMQAYSFTSLGRMGSLAKPAVPGLLTIMTNPAPDDVRFSTVWTLTKIDAPKLVTVLTNVADAELRSTLTRVLLMVDSETAAAAGIRPIGRKTGN
jgi:hypothetical protein